MYWVLMTVIMTYYNVSVFKVIQIAYLLLIQYFSFYVSFNKEILHIMYLQIRYI